MRSWLGSCAAFPAMPTTGSHDRLPRLTSSHHTWHTSPPFLSPRGIIEQAKQDDAVYSDPTKWPLYGLCIQVRSGKGVQASAAGGFLARNVQLVNKVSRWVHNQHLNGNRH